MFCRGVMKRHSSLLWSLLSWWWWWWWVWKWPEKRNLNQDPLRWSFDKPFCNNKSSSTAFLMSIFNTSSESISPEFVVIHVLCKLPTTGSIQTLHIDGTQLCVPSAYGTLLASVASCLLLFLGLVAISFLVDNQAAKTPRYDWWPLGARGKRCDV